MPMLPGARSARCRPTPQPMSSVTPRSRRRRFHRYGRWGSTHRRHPPLGVAAAERRRAYAASSIVVPGGAAIASGYRLRHTLTGVVVAVVLTYAAPAGMLEACVASVLRADAIDHLVVVDNGASAAVRLATIDDARLEVLTTGENLGYAGGMNVGIRRALDAGGDFVLVLNDDLKVEPGVVPPLLAAMDDPHIGAVQPKLLLAGTDPPLVNSVGVELGRDGAGRDVGIGEPDGPAFAAGREVLACTGGAVLLRRGLIDDTGGFDERYFLYYEDVDLALRGAAHGWRYRCEPAAVVHHHGSVSTAHESVAGRSVYLRERNRLWVLFRHRPVADIGRGVWLSMRRLRWAPRRVHARALFAGLLASPPLVRDRLRQMHGFGRGRRSRTHRG